MLSQGVGSENLKTLQEVYLNFWRESSFSRASARSREREMMSSSRRFGFLPSPPALESQVFTSRTPWAFYSMYGPAGTVINQEMALDALEDDLTVMSRTVRLFSSLPSFPRFILPCSPVPYLYLLTLGRQRSRLSRRRSSHPILPTQPPSSSRSSRERQTLLHNTSSQWPLFLIVISSSGRRNGEVEECAGDASWSCWEYEWERRRAVRRLCEQEAGSVD